MSIVNVSLADLRAGLPKILASPTDDGVLAMIVRRPAIGERAESEVATLDVADGLVGDNWKFRKRPHPEMQLTLMNARAAALIAQDRSRWPLAGDQLYVELDLSVENLPAGSRLRVGEALVEITPAPHRGCRKFAERFGRDAMKFVNSEIGCKLNLRGVNSRVIEGGEIKLEDVVFVERRGT